MNNSRKEGRPTRNLVKPLVFAVALSVPLSAAFAADMGDVVKTRADQTIDQQYGRDSVYAFSLDAKPMTPERTTGATGDGFFGKMKSYGATAWHKTEALAGAAWAKTQSSSDAAAAIEPQGYGRAGGYVGSDRIAILSGSTSYSANSSANVVTSDSLPGAANDTRSDAQMSSPTAQGSTNSAVAQDSSPVGVVNAPNEGRSSGTTAMERESQRASDSDPTDMSRAKC
ncbi:MAG: hypothetical protein ABI612_07940 [Betaproteobacteria bacterium]